MRIDVHRAARYSVRLEKVKTFRSSGNNAKGGGMEKLMENGARYYVCKHRARRARSKIRRKKKSRRSGKVEAFFLFSFFWLVPSINGRAHWR